MRTTGLTDEEAARLQYVLCYAAAAFDSGARTVSNVPVAVLGRVYPKETWSVVSRKDRISIVY